MWLIKRTPKEGVNREKVEEKMGVIVSNTYMYMRRLRLNNEKRCCSW